MKTQTPSDDAPSKYWFPAKRYGWGWGPPTCWQGWAVLIAWFAIQILVSIELAQQQRTITLLIFSVTMAVLLIAVCWWKGEPPRWRWG